MSLIHCETLINPCCAAQLLNISKSSLMKGINATHELTRVPKGDGEKRTRVSFVLEEVLLLKARQIEAARNVNENVLRLVKRS